MADLAVQNTSSATPVAVAWAIDGSISGSGVGTVMPQSQDLEITAKNAQIENQIGTTVCDVTWNPSQTCSYEVVPYGITKILARAAAVLPLPGTIVTLTNFLGDATTGTIGHNEQATGVGNAGVSGNTAKWIFRGGSQKKTKDGEVKLTFKLEQFIIADVSTIIAT